MNEWDYSKNTKLPSEFTPRSDKKVWWICEKGHSYEMEIYKKTAEKPYKCPICSGKKLLVGYNDLKTLFPEVAEEWDYDKNNTIPENHIAGTHKKAYWKCKQCDNEWEAQIKQRTYGGTSCPKCSFYYKTSIPEQAIYYYVKKIFPDAINSYKPDFLDGMEYDVYIPSLKVAIEYDGRFWHYNSERDKRKSELSQLNEIKLIRCKEGNNTHDYNDYVLIYSHYNDKIIQLDSTIRELFIILNDIFDTIIDIDINLERDATTIYSLSEGIKKSKSLLATDSIVLMEWAYNLNGNLTPDKVTPGSRKSVYWHCSKCGKAFKRSIKKSDSCVI